MSYQVGYSCKAACTYGPVSKVRCRLSFWHCRGAGACSTDLMLVVHTTSAMVLLRLSGYRRMRAGRRCMKSTVEVQMAGIRRLLVNTVQIFRSSSVPHSSVVFCLLCYGSRTDSLCSDAGTTEPGTTVQDVTSRDEHLKLADVQGRFVLTKTFQDLNAMSYVVTSTLIWDASRRRTRVRQYEPFACVRAQGTLHTDVSLH